MEIFGGANNVKNSAERGYRNTRNWFRSGSPLSKIVLAFLFIFAILLIVHILKGIFQGINGYRYSQIWLNGGKTFCPKTSVVLPGRLFHKSHNELAGTEFTYCFWMYINDWSFKYGQWKHVLHKGNANSWPNRAPGIWLHPRDNTMRFYMNTFDSVAGNFIDIENIPINKWFHVVFSVNQLTMDIYFNGNMRKSFKFTSLPRQNYGNVYVMSFRGFDGYLSRAVYYNYTIPYSEIEKLIEMGPGPIDCGKMGEMPPYLTPPWWTSTYSKVPEYDTRPDAVHV